MVAVIPGVRGLPVPLESSVVTLGSFDGVHRGHQTLIKRAVEAAQARGVPSVGYTFHPHPATVLSPAKAPPTIMGIEERAYTMGQYGLDYVLVQPFDADFAGVTADQFVADYLVAPLHPAHVVVGFNFTYGRARAGDT
ncbi:MAG: bifunctional riboflavin kinase/FAD synthetase, partial [Myxococcota bacterium]